MLDNQPEMPKVISLFAGCGGLDFGFHNAGFEVVSAYDNDPAAVECYNKNRPAKAQNINVHADLELDSSASVIVAGPPCQGFSTGGGYKDNDARNDLLLETCKLVAKQQIRLAVIENVGALTNRRNELHLDAALTTLKDAGYRCSYQVHSATEFGVAQRRKRTLIFARLGSSEFAPFTQTDSLKPTVREALQGVHVGLQGHSPTFPAKNSKHALIAKRIGPGQKLCNVRGGDASVATWEIPEWFGKTSKVEQLVLQTIRVLRRRNRKRDFGDADPVTLKELQGELKSVDLRMLNDLVHRGFLRKVGSEFDLKETFNGKYRRLDLDDVSPTVDTRFGDIQLFLHPTEDRGLTVREAARLQGFPDDFIFPESDKDAFRLIGNAVPPPMSLKIAQTCRELLL